MKSQLEVLRLCQSYLEDRGMANARREAEWVMSEALACPRLQLYLDHDRPLSDDELARCRSWLQRRGRGEPIAYIRGFVDFLDCRIGVDSRVLIPRHETEWMVDTIAKTLQDEDLVGKVLCDICTGSGCIAIALKKRFPQLTVYGSDISLEALELAQKNAHDNDVEVIWRCGDLLEGVADVAAIDFFVCNPPYVSIDELSQLEPEVREFEPHLALAAGSDGLDFYRRLASTLPQRLNPGGRAWLEVGSTQGQAVLELFLEPLWQQPSLLRDLSGHGRTVSLVLAS